MFKFLTKLKLIYFFSILMAMACPAICSSYGKEAVAPFKGPQGSTAPKALDEYNVIWNSPSNNSSGSMPIGNGDIGLNVWVEENGDLLFYIGKTDSWSENARLLKLGRIRIKLSPNPFIKGLSFRQELKLRHGEIEISAGSKESPINIRLWVDALEPVIRIEAEGKEKFEIQASLEVWRTTKRKLKFSPASYPHKQEIAFSDPYNRAFGDGSKSGIDTIVYPDVILNEKNDRIIWYHHNVESAWRKTMNLQGLSELASNNTDPLLHRTFGGIIKGEEMGKVDATTLKSIVPRNKQLISIYPLTKHPVMPDQWVGELEQIIDRIEARPINKARLAHRNWWSDFWDRSWIDISGPKETKPIIQNQLPLRIGADSEGENRFNGKIARVRIWSDVLSPDRLKLISDQGRDAVSEKTPAILADWRFNGTNDNVFNSQVGPCFVARSVGSVTSNKDGLELNGSGYLEITHDSRLDLTKGFTLESWIYLKKPAADGVSIINKFQNNNAQGYMLGISPTNSLMTIAGDSTLRSIWGESILPVGRWVHIASTYNPIDAQLRFYINGDGVAARHGSVNSPTVVSQGYALQRFINACGGRGAYPIKFNGSIFTVDNSSANESYNADYRRWGGAYWFQNTRLIYWAMLRAGDYDLMQPFFQMYRNILPTAKARTPVYCGHEGAFFPETMYFWGTYSNPDYGWNRKVHPIGYVTNSYVRNYLSGGLELVTMMLDYYEGTQDEEFFKSTLLPIAESVATFYDLHWDRDENHKIRFAPASSLETWHEVVNPFPEIAGLKFVLNRLLKLPTEFTSQQQRVTWERMLTELPELPAKIENGKKYLLPAQIYADTVVNRENPALYGVFPYRLFGLGKPELEVVMETWRRRTFKNSGGWAQDSIQAAYLGLAKTAAQYTAGNFASWHARSRFPAFWGPNADFVPDQDHGSVAMIALQRMLMQAEGKKILLFPAWPKEWDVQFKLHAPYNTTVEGIYRDGKLVELEVTPKSRRKDIIKMIPQ
jgi:hypothetical protein